MFEPVTLLGSPDKYRKIELQCDDNSSLLLFDELDQANMNCMLVELMKLGSDSTKYCLRNVFNFLPKRLSQRLSEISYSVHCSSLYLDWRWSLETCIEQEEQMTRIHEECGGGHTEGRVFSKIINIHLDGKGGRFSFFFSKKINILNSQKP